MRITSKGQVTIPQDVRDQAGLMPGTDVEFVLEGKRVVLRKAKVAGKATRGQKLVERLAGTGSYDLGVDEIIRLMRGPPADADAPPHER
ncbi:MAG: hypothetical protein RIR41_3010 [Pseudomonadota bacterium]|jgi:AbrB family looped-hinge helix DNA binding protein